MKERWLRDLFCFLLCGFIISTSVWAGQIITPEVREWAKDVLKKEKRLELSAAPNTLAILYFANRSGKKALDPLQKGLALMLITDLSKVGGLQVVERAKLQALIEEMEMGATGLVDPNTLPRMGKLLGAQWVIGGDIGETQAPFLQIRSSLLDVTSQKVLKQAASTGELAEIFRMEKNILFDIIRQLRIELTPEEEEALRKPIAGDIHSLFSLVKGIESSDRGNYERSVRLYQRSLKDDPAMTITRDALSELKTRGLIPAMGRSGTLVQFLRTQTSLTDQLTPEYPIKREMIPSDVVQIIDQLVQPEGYGFYIIPVEIEDPEEQVYTEPHW